ncbi:MAG TPA: hypothetical protein PKJ95_06230, partial [Atribacterota bacterium]|nr:hypothetical protein [Atribacterota bacterium]
PEVARLTGKTVNTIYRYIRNDKLRYNRVIYQGREVYRIEKKELQRVFKCNISGDISDISEDITGDISSDISKDTSDISEDKIQRAIEKAISQQQAVFLKPIEDQALYRLGRMEQENSFLKAKVETLLQELDQYKSLPGPADIEKMQKENQEKEKDLIIQIELERKEKTDLLSREKETEEKHRRELSELETRQEEQNELHREELQQTWKQAEDEQKNYLATIEELKKRLQEEEKRPWYRRLFS